MNWGKNGDDFIRHLGPLGTALGRGFLSELHQFLGPQRTFLYSILIFHLNLNLELYEWGILSNAGDYRGTHNAFYSTDHLGDVFQHSL